MENKAQLVITLEKSLRNKIRKFCDGQGLKISKFAERALVRELESEGGKEALAGDVQEETENKGVDSTKSNGY